MARIRHLVIASLAASLLVAALPAASAAGTYAAPEPKYFNICGTASDRLEIPVYFVHPDFGLGGYYVNGAPASGTVYANTIAAGADGIRRMVVTTDYDSGSWTYAFDDQPCGEPAPNAYSVSLGACDALSHETSALATITNTADMYGQSLDIYVDVNRRQDGWDTGAYDAASRIEDGETRAVSIRGAMDIGLLPGDYDVSFLTTDSKTVLASRPLTVPSCGGLNAPNYEDPSHAGGGKPSGTLRQLRSVRAMNVKLVNQKVGTFTKFRLTIDRPGPGGKRLKKFRVEAFTTLKAGPFSAPIGSVFVLRVMVLTKISAGNFVMKPVEVARARMTARPKR